MPQQSIKFNSQTFLKEGWSFTEKGHKIPWPILNHSDATPFKKLDIAVSGITRPEPMLKGDRPIW